MPAFIGLLKFALFALILTTVGIIVYRAVSLRRVPISLCLFLILPTGQLLLLYSLSYVGWSVYWLLGLLLSVAAGILFLLYAISQEKKTTAMEELQMVRHRMELEKSHYLAVEQRREALEEIRREFNSKLEVVAGFVHSGKDAVARENIAALAANIYSTHDNDYCNIPVINAILTQKMQTSSSAGIELAIELNMPATLAIADIHLCSILGNLLDNAIAACQKRGGTGKPVINLSSIVDGDYLFIKVTNPADKPSIISTPGHGYGQRILSELAGQYEGSFHSHYCNEVYTAVVSLALTAAGQLRG